MVYFELMTAAACNLQCISRMLRKRYDLYIFTQKKIIYTKENKNFST